MPLRINLLADQHALEEMRRRDPVKRALWIGAFLVVVVLLWSSSLLAKSMLGKSELSRMQGDLNSRTNDYRQILDNKHKLEEINVKLAALHRLATNRFLAGNLLNAIQEGVLDEVQVTRLKVDQSYVVTEEVKASSGEKITKAKPATVTEKITLTLGAKDTSSDPGAAISKYQETLLALPYFQSSFGKPVMLSLKQRGNPLPDADGKIAVVFSLECRFPGYNTMKNLSKEKRNQLIMVVLLIGAVLVGLYFGLIRNQQQGLAELATQQTVAQGKVDQVKQAIRSAEQIETELALRRKLLDEQEENMASGDKFLWMIDFIRKFKAAYRVDIPQFDKATISDVNLLPRFPYKQISLSISGAGFYHDIGQFIADFENQFPSSRVLNLDLQPGSAQVREDQEKLSFRMDIVTLVKSDSP